MHKLTRGAWGRLLAVGTCFTFVMTTLLASLAVAPPTAQAQIGGLEPTVKPPPRAAVVEFKAPPGAMLGRRAADAVSVALRDMEMRGAPYAPEPADAVATALQELGLAPPLEREGQQQLGEQLAVKWVISGEVRQANVARGKAEVDLLVTVLSVESGDYATGALVRASSPVPPGYRGDHDILIDKALATAARDATRLAAAGKIPEATVLMVFGRNDVQLSAGKPAGLLRGMRLALLRLVEGHWRRVGTLEVTRSGNHDASAAIIAAPRGIQTNDRVMAIWEPSKAEIGMVTKPEKKRKPSLQKGLLALLAVGAAFLIGSRHKDRPDRQVSSTPTACALVDGDGVVISWSPPDDNVVAVEIWRIAGGDRMPVAVVGRGGPLSGWFGQHRYVDTILAVPGSLCISIPEDQVEQPNIPTPLYEGTLGVGDPCDADNTETSRQIIWTPVPLVDGVPVSYQLVFIAQKVVQNAGEVGSGQQATSQWVFIEYKTSKQSNTATPLAPVTLVRPSGTTGEDPTNTEFRFTAEGDPDVALPTTGANQYVIQISRDPSFAPGQTGEYPAPPDYHRAVYPPGDDVRLFIDYSDMLTPAERAGCVQLFWRVGARNLADRCLPVAYPEDPSRAGWVFGPTTSIAMFKAGAGCT
ncbi:hypothetical protein AMK68_02260 [candidate division KD3-62 bacterium DG_56]|uniref:FlgO domain-containing protein n=1 Tax=candidate division KD3-62 bacterium DG_56 TaxID=1704032 RepID=A0A0S7XNP5_9BACT|nr:MAG: hypothetical protein AMK68_02260 [candidate division KD3-62 bacterium DG_56]